MGGQKRWLIPFCQKIMQNSLSATIVNERGAAAGVN
jgi:hypothetical protein